ncbi:MAG: hypothetical protein V7746_00200 [Halioglobus sp.]
MIVDGQAEEKRASVKSLKGFAEGDSKDQKKQARLFFTNLNC